MHDVPMPDFTPELRPKKKWLPGANNSERMISLAEPTSLHRMAGHSYAACQVDGCSEDAANLLCCAGLLTGCDLANIPNCLWPRSGTLKSNKQRLPARWP